MADFSYTFANTSTTEENAKFEKLYANKIEITTGLDIFYNDDTTTHIAENGNSLTILGYVFKSGSDAESYAFDLLHNFKEERIVEAKKNLSGQFIAIINKGGKIYIFSDFLQTRSIYYDVDRKSASSSFAATGSEGANDYKTFEFLAMKHCIYPAWLGNTTIYNSIKRVRAYEYLKIDIACGQIELHDFQFTLDNSKIKSLRKTKKYTLSLLRDSIRHPSCKDKKICSTITGGFDSRLVTLLAGEYYTDMNLRISSYKGEKSLDLKIASRIADVLELPLNIHHTDLESQIQEFYVLTDGLTPRENAVMTTMLENTGSCSLGFGGAFGTELYTSVAHNTTDEMISAFTSDIRTTIEAHESYYIRFEQALRDEIENIRRHYLLNIPDQRDIMRLFRLINTGYFSSQIVSAFNIHAKQFEVFGTFPVIEGGLKIRYEYMGSKTTFGRFYMIPKSLAERINRKVSRINTTHFCPMRPLSVCSFASYIIGKLKMKLYYKKQGKLQRGRHESLSYTGSKFRYESSRWFEGFMLKHLTRD